MNLEIVKELPYISPSSFMAWRNCQYFTYLSKCSGHKLPEQPTSKAAAFGTMFDILVKKWLNRKHGWEFDEQTAWANLTYVSEDGKIISDAIATFKMFRRTVEQYDLLNDIRETEDGIHGKHNGAAVFGYPDIRLADNIPLDLKTTGYDVKYTVSPKPGYDICYNIDNGIIYKTVHKDSGEALNIINEAWAIQLLFYCWLMDREPPYRGKIFQVLVDRRLLAIYDAWIEDEFVELISKELKVMWEMFRYGNCIPEPMPDKVNCVSFGQVCRAAEVCNFYKNWNEVMG